LPSAALVSTSSGVGVGVFSDVSSLALPFLSLTSTSPHPEATSSIAMTAAIGATDHLDLVRLTVSPLEERPCT
jgi:hypothetical protein